MRVLAVICALWAGQAVAECRQALALGLDVSGSVDAREYRLQLDGLANALENPEVAAAFLAMPQAPVSLAVFEWSGAAAQRGLLDWTAVTDGAVLAGIAARLRAVARVPLDPSTAIGAAKAHGAALLAQQPGCWRQVLDLSGDGQSNTGPRPQDVRPGGITINALVIGTPETPGRAAPGLGELVAYFRAYVIEGDQAFVETAQGFEAFEAAMVRKLKRELQVMVLSGR
ncbi:DUF1194 domain-containing protein [Tropicibacter oceani]|uniref:DUF1194 domain-containing protein n=1 Tax=Tropicibacter oceani TaxID=3058420 RepID=A0ABY8QN45_9RHOB|nr:DUF1194 domain-containing protein [Tropicibacter oceani]WGW05438.1 DUF1194 domain-containing protein [Tropicibacter oceani]